MRYYNGFLGGIHPTFIQAMKYPELLGFADLLPRLDQFDAILDVRSPAEYALDHIPGAINCPVLDDQQRITVGTLYKQVGAFEAKKVGAALVARNIGQMIETRFLDHPKSWTPLIYCWRGGNRSGSLAYILAKIGWPVAQLDGGYKSFRHQVMQDLPQLASQLAWRVLCGTTGSGKSRMLTTLAKHGAQVLDLEQLALHRGSVLGHIPRQPQPAQKSFESRIWQALRQFDPAQPVWVEAESKKIGNLRVPDALMDTMRAADCVQCHLAQDLRVQLLLQDYTHFTENPAQLKQQLEFLSPLHGRAKISAWSQLIDAGQLTQLVQQLLTDHYDPAYLRSIERNFSRYAQAPAITLHGITADDFAKGAIQLMAG